MCLYSWWGVCTTSIIINLGGIISVMYNSRMKITKRLSLVAGRASTKAFDEVENRALIADIVDTKALQCTLIEVSEESYTGDVLALDKVIKDGSRREGKDFVYNNRMKVQGIRRGKGKEDAEGFLPLRVGAEDSVSCYQS